MAPEERALTPLPAPLSGVVDNPIEGIRSGGMRVERAGVSLLSILPDESDGALACIYNGRPLSRLTAEQRAHVAALEDAGKDATEQLRAYALAADGWRVRITAPGDIVHWVRPQPEGRAAQLILGVLIAAVSAYFNFAPGVQIGIGLAIGGALQLLIPVRGAPNQGPAAQGVYSDSLAGNAARLDAPIWKVCGRVKITPPFAANPYTQYLPHNPATPTVDCDQYYYAIFALSEGENADEKAFLGATQIGHFDDIIRQEYLPPGTQPSIALANVYTSEEVSSSQLQPGDYVGPYAACRPQSVVSAIGIDVGAEQGLGDTDSHNDLLQITVQWIVEVRTIDDFGTPIGNWQTIASETRTANTNTPQRWTNTYELAAPERIEVRLARTNTQDTNSTARDSIQWIGLRSFLSRPATPSAGPDVVTLGAPQRAFAWYDASAGTSSDALEQPDYSDPSLNYYTSPPDAEYWSDLRPASSSSAPSPYVDSGGSPVAVASPSAGYGLVVWASGLSKFFALGVRTDLTTQYEYELNADGSVYSKTALSTPFGSVGVFPQGALVLFNSYWRAWVVDGDYTYFLKRTSAGNWASTQSWIDTTHLFATIERVLGAAKIGSTLVLALGSTGGVGAEYTYLRLAYSTTGDAPWNNVSPTYDLAAGVPFSGVSQTSELGPALILVGSLVAVYFHRGSAPWVAISASDFTSMSMSALTLDGVAPPQGAAGELAGFVGTADGSYIAAYVSRPSGAGFSHHLAVSADGVAFTTVSDADLLPTISGSAALDVGQFVRPLLSQGSKFLYERSMAVQTTTPAGQVIAGPFAPLNPNVAHYEVVMRSSNQLTQLSQRDFSIILRASVRTLNAALQWQAPTFSRNAAWWLAELWTNPIWGEGLPDSRIDLQSIYDLAQTCDARQDRFDYCFTTAVDSWAAAQLIASSCRARVFRRNGVYTVARDDLETLPVGAISPRIAQPKSMLVHATLPKREQADGFVVQYTSNVTWDTATVECPCPGFSAVDATAPLYDASLPAMANPVYITLDGVTGATHAMREGIYQAASLAYRATSVEATIEMEGVILSFMDLIRWQPQIAGYGQAGDVAFWNPSTLVMGLSEPPAFGPAPLYLTLVRDDGSLTTPVAVTSGPTPNDLTLPAAPDFDMILDDGLRERPRFLLGPLTSGDEMAKITSIAPGGSTSDGAALYKVAALIDDARVHEADNAYLPGPGDVQDPVDDGVTSSDVDYSTVVNIDAVRNGGTTYAVGVTISGINPDWTLAVSLPSGQLYSGWSPWASDGDRNVTNSGKAWGNEFQVTTDLRVGSTVFGANSIESTGPLAIADFSGGTVTGSTSYTFWIQDSNPGDNRGGLSILVVKDT